MIEKHYTIYVKGVFDKIFVEKFDNYKDAYKALQEYQAEDPLSYYFLEITKTVV